MNWDFNCTDEEKQSLRPKFQRTARHRRIEPDEVAVERESDGTPVRMAMFYRESNKWDRIGIQNLDGSEIVESWSTIQSWLRPLIGDQVTAIEVFPRTKDVVDTAPIRWFWVVPNGCTLHSWDLRNV